MTVNAAGFYVTAVLVVAAALATVALPSPRHAVIAGLGFVVTVALLLAVSGAYLVATAQLVIPAAAAALLWWQAREHRAPLLNVAPTRAVRLWQFGAVVAVICAILLVVILATRGSELAQCVGSCGGGGLLSVLHWREPVGVAAALVLAALSVSAVVVIASESEAERSHDAVVEERVRKRERIERRRADREAARRKPEVKSS